MSRLHEKLNVTEMEQHDVIIVGAGPGGLKAAEVLAKRGKDVLVLEKNNIVGPKVCAGGLTTKDEGLVDKNLIERAFDSIIVASKRQRIRISDNKPFVYTASRKNLGQWQLKKAEKEGVEVRINVNVTSIKNNSVLVNGTEIGFRYLIGADGSNSIVRKHLGLRNEKVMMAMQYIVEQEYDDMEIDIDGEKFSFGYAWIFPHKRFTSIGCAADLKYIKTSELKENFHKWMKERNIDYKNGKFEAFLINYDYKGFEFGNKFLIGDAAGFTSGLTGEGIFSAMLSGEEVAKKIIDSSYSFDVLKKYMRLKSIHEKLLSFMKMHNKLINIKQEIIVFLLRSKIISKKAISIVT